MTAELAAVAQAAGIAPTWRDVFGTWHEVAPETLRAVLTALDLPAHSDADIAQSHDILQSRNQTLPPLVTATANTPEPIPASGPFIITLDDGTRREGIAENGILPGIDRPGYHTLEINGRRVTLAIAPTRAFTIEDAAPGTRPWALAAQLYALRRPGDGGIGDFRALQDLIPSAARLGAAGIAISPVHAQFSADPDRFSPYSPSSRMQLNVLHATIDLPPEAAALEAEPLVPWSAAARLRLAALRNAFDNATPATLSDLARFRATEGSALETHATFEALHAHQFAAGNWHWRNWPGELQDPASPAVTAFAAAHAEEIALHAFMQFIADRSLAAAQATARDAGMPIGLIADLAVGADSGGSHCWSRQEETLLGMGIGAPPDLLSTQGQNWGLAAFSPRGLRDNGYRAFLEMLRHAMRHAGGVRIDHALGLARLWVVPDGASSKDGAYLAMPSRDLLRLIALESTRHRAIVLGEDLGTIPEGFQSQLGDAGIMGLRVLWFEKQHGLFTEPTAWTKAAAGVTSTHDLATTAGWWAGRDVEWRTQLNLAGENETEEREIDREALWAAFQHSGATTSPAPQPEDADTIVDAATAHLATAACDLVILPLEDALALTEQPNLPGTMDEHPNWRRRLNTPAKTLLEDPKVTNRLKTLTQKRR